MNELKARILIGWRLKVSGLVVSGNKVKHMNRLTQPAWVARIWEDGTFSLGRVPFVATECEVQEERSLYDEETQELLKYMVDSYPLTTVKAMVDGFPEVYKKRLVLSPIGSSTVPNSHRETVKRGQLGISAHGRKLVRNAALRLEKECGNFTLSFLTLTIPGLGEEGALTICENWHHIVRVFQQRLKRMLQRKGLTGEMVGVTEVQEKRFAATNVVALHLHIVFQGRQFGCGWVLSPGDVRAAWREVLTPYMDGCSDEPYWDACENIVRVKHSASGYLGKYLSKGVNATKAIREVYPDIVLPSCWYLCTNTLRTRVKAHVLYFTDREFPVFDTMCSSNDSSEYFLFVHPIEIDKGNGEVFRCGYVGKIKDSWRLTLIDALGLASKKNS
jgi:hypothetical protein